jgi:DNA-binding CsgD family transcriptional regulator
MNTVKSDKEPKNLRPKRRRILEKGLSSRHIALLAILGTDLNYREMGKIAEMSPRSVEALRDDLLDFFGLGNRTAVVVAGLRRGYITLSMIPSLSSAKYQKNPSVVTARTKGLFLKMQTATVSEGSRAKPSKQEKKVGTAPVGRKKRADRQGS